MLLGAIGASGGILVASSPAQASVPSGEIYAPNAPGTQEADWQAAHQTRTIEAIEDYARQVRRRMVGNATAAGMPDKALRGGGCGLLADNLC